MITIFVALAIIVFIFATIISVRNGKDNKVKQRLNDERFIPYETFISTWDRSFIALNFEEKRIALGRGDSLTICNFSQILQVDLLRNDTTVTSMDKGSVAGRAIVGSILLGGIGAVIGATTAKSHTAQEANKLILRIATNDGTFSVIFLDLNNSARAGMDSIRNSASTATDKFYGFVLKAMRSADEGPKATEPNRAIPKLKPIGSTPTVSSELNALWQLKKQGAISDEEFELAKKGILPR